MFKQSEKTKKDLNKKVGNDSTKKPIEVSSTTVNESNFSRDALPSSKSGNTIIGENISIEGNIRAEENLTIEGFMKGNVKIEKHNFSVGSKGRFEGEIRANNMIIGGLLSGKVNTTGKVEITKNADFYGTIKADSIAIEEGAFFKGEIELGREPHKKDDSAGKQMKETEHRGKQVSSIPSLEAVKEN
ncbi:MAG: polymer-forming cytoskeletal protein [Desulfobacterales bacterium]|nr:polymer-forming cytoskeletal protein [Desulfobacterales bacterium]